MIHDTSGQDFGLAAPPFWRRRWPWLLAGAVVVLGAGWLWLSPGAAERSVGVARLRLAKVTRGPFVSDVSAQGKVIAAVSPTLYASSAGAVRLRVGAGERVTRGQVLAVVDSPEIANEAAREQAHLAGLEATLARERLAVQARRLALQQTVDLAGVAVDAAQRELKRAQDAHAQGVLPVMEVDRRGDQLTEALVRFQHARKDAALQDRGLDFEWRARQLEVDRQGLLVENQQRRVDELQLRSPVDGVIGSLAVSDRAAVAANQALMTVVDLSRLAVDIQVPETYADALGIDMPAEVRVGNQAYAARLVAVSPEVNNNQVVGRVAFDGGTPAELRQNQRVTVRIVLDSRQDVLQLPRGSFLDSGGGRYAYALRGDLATRLPISIGAVSIDRVEIAGGLAVGDEVVISGDQDFDNAATVLVRR